jgi:hypothetical protein
MRERARRVTAMEDVIARNLPPAGTYARAGAELPPDALNAVHMRLDALHGRQDDIYAALYGRQDDIYKALRDLTAIVAAPAATTATDKRLTGTDVRQAVYGFVIGLFRWKIWLAFAGLALTIFTSVKLDAAWWPAVASIGVIVSTAILGLAHVDAHKEQGSAQIASAHIMTGRRGPPAR